MNRLNRRDWEILRTLVRLRYVTTAEIAGVFFGSGAPARRRLRVLSREGFIATHRKGIPERLPYFAWRLTSRGVEALASGFRDEPVPDGLVERLAEGSLLHLEHHEALSALYFALLASRAGSMPGTRDDAALATVVNGLRARASQVFWQPDGDVILRFTHLGAPQQIVPDATVCGRDIPARIFVELDRSTRSLARIDEALERYAAFFCGGYDALFPDGRRPGLLYVVRSEGRREGIAAHAARILGDAARWHVATEREALRWLEREVLDPARDAELPEAGEEAGSDEVEHAARKLYGWARSYEKNLRAEGRTLPPEGETRLLDLYRALRRRKVPTRAA